MNKSCCQGNSAPLSLLTAPFLLGLAIMDNLTQELIQMKKASEEIFRGERLPILKVEPMEDEE